MSRSVGPEPQCAQARSTALPSFLLIHKGITLEALSAFQLWFLRPSLFPYVFMIPYSSFNKPPLTRNISVFKFTEMCGAWGRVTLPITPQSTENYILGFLVDKRPFIHSLLELSHWLLPHAGPFYSNLPALFSFLYPIESTFFLP